MSTHKEFVEALLPHAIEAIGAQHGHLVQWALAKAAHECGWDLDNALILQANNCLGIKAEDCMGQPFDGVAYLILEANTGPEAGRTVHWRAFMSLGDCFDELVRMWNDRSPFSAWRVNTLVGFESAYTNNLRGHPIMIAAALHEVRNVLTTSKMVDTKGRFA